MQAISGCGNLPRIHQLTVKNTIFTDLSPDASCFSRDNENRTSFVFPRVLELRDVLDDCSADVSNDCPLI